MPDFFGIYDEMTVTEYLSFFGAAYGIKPNARRVIIDDVLELTDLAEKRDALIQNLSRGMQQRLGLARVLVHDPQVLLLDEPASGLDPRARIEMKALLQELQNMGKTILISSHILTELAQLCNKIGIIEKGELIYSGTIEEVVTQMQGGRRIQVSVRGDMESAHRVLLELGITSIEQTNGYLSAEVSFKLDLADISTALFKAGLPVTRLHEEELQLEDVFMSVTEGGVQ
jgi:ABC-2 type transport system ATP-binding protein